MTRPDLVALASGGSEQTKVLTMLCQGQRDKNMLLVGGLVRVGSKVAPAAAPMLKDNFELLASIEELAPEVVAAVIGSPQVGAWAARCLRRLATEPAQARIDLEHFAAVAAAAAIRAGYACTVSVRPIDGVVMLPTLGRALLPGCDDAKLSVEGPMRATIYDVDRALTIDGVAERDAPGWQGLRWLTLGSHQITLDDLDPYREYGRCRLAGRLSEADFDHWRLSLEAAWELLREHYPDYADALQIGVASLVPITLQPGQKNLSATSGDAFAAVAASRPSDGASLALALIHEFQHAKLCATVDLEPLFERHHDRLFYAPWRPDPRPGPALFHGVFAHMGVADYWRVYRHIASGEAQLVAEVEFTRWLRQTIDAAAQLDGYDGLTPAGEFLLARIVTRLQGWLDEPVRAEARELAATTAADHRICWRLRNLVPDPASVTAAAEAWRAGKRPPADFPVLLCPPDDNSGRTVRSDLLYDKLCAPARFGASLEMTADDPDLAYVQGDHSVALRGYLHEIAATADSQHAWGGLGLLSDTDSALRRCPEVVSAVYQEITWGSGESADPRRLADWLGPVVARTDVL